MSNAVKVTDYDPDTIVITVNGTPISGYADGTFVSVERDEDSWTTVVGSQGEVARARSRNLSGKITLTLMQTSASNALLEGLMIADDYSQQGQFVVSIADTNYKGICLSDSSWIVKPAILSYGRELEDREWTIQCARIEYLGAYGQESNPEPS